MLRYLNNLKGMPFIRFILTALKRLYYYPKMDLSETNYDKYWEDKRSSSMGTANSYQIKRASLIEKRIETGSSVLDLGCGDGAVLFQLMKFIKIDAIGADISEKALKYLQSKGIKTIKCDLNNADEIDSLPEVEYILLLEVLEHMQNPEKFLLRIQKKARKGLFISFPNTGYITYRLRLLFGRFPVQWRVHPGEHLRFWTYKDLKWWLKEMELHNQTDVCVYEGVPFLNKIMPGLFGAAFILQIKEQ
jgi:methionine biosynthesis protein MetW